MNPAARKRVDLRRCVRQNEVERHEPNKLMCCFSRPVISVSATNIFARAGVAQSRHVR